MDRFKAVMVGLLALVGIIVVFQNTERVETHFLFFSVEMPRALLLAVTLLVGIAIGVILTYLSIKRRGR